MGAAALPPHTTPGNLPRVRTALLPLRAACPASRGGGRPTPDHERLGHERRHRRRRRRTRCARGTARRVADLLAGVLPRTGRWDLALFRPAPVRGYVLGGARAVGLRGGGDCRQLVLPAPRTPAMVHREHRPAPCPPPRPAHSELQPAALPRRESAFSPRDRRNACAECVRAASRI